MFPVDFAETVIREYSDSGQGVLDPFLGRGTTVAVAEAMGRWGVGVEINPVGWVYSAAKIAPADETRVLQRLGEIGTLSESAKNIDSEAPSPFFPACFSEGVLRFLVTARRRLNWRRSRVDRTLAAFLLTYLHGKRESALSNQMRQTKAYWPDYSVSWWSARDMDPPDVEPVDFIRQRIEWRYRHGSPEPSRKSRAYLGDATRVLQRLSHQALLREGFSLILTSPPYYGITNYHKDQWLRLWLLGGQPRPSSGSGPYRGRFLNLDRYARLLLRVFKRSADLLAPGGTAFVRTDSRPTTRWATLDALRVAFRGARIDVRDAPLEGASQTALFGDSSQKPGECDMVVSTPKRRL